MSPGVREAAELIIGNLNEDGYLIASDDELMGVAPPASPEADATVVEKVVKEAAALGLVLCGNLKRESGADEIPVAGSELDRRRFRPADAANGTVLAAAVAPAPTPEPPKPACQFRRKFTSPTSTWKNSTKRSKSCASWILRESAAAICANACLHQLALPSGAVGFRQA